MPSAATVPAPFAASTATLVARPISSDALRRASDTLSLPASSTSGAMPDAGNERKCLRSRSALGLNDAYVIPPDTTPPITGTAFPAVFANVFFVTLIPMAPRIFFIRGYQAVFVSALRSTVFTTWGMATSAAKRVSCVAAVPTPSITPMRTTSSRMVSSSISSLSSRNVCHP